MIKKYFENSKLQTLKFNHYFDIYDELFYKFKNKKITFVEIGVLYGGSLSVWKNYFGTDAKIIGVDINPKLKKFETDQIKIEIGDQSNIVFWENFFKKHGPVDILLDDGSHLNYSTISTVYHCIKNIKNNGLLIVEDTHCSYSIKYGNPSKYSFINYAKKCIDELHSDYIEGPKFKNSIQENLKNIIFYPGITVFKISDRKFRTYDRAKYGTRTLKIQDTMTLQISNNKLVIFLKKLIKTKSLKIIKRVFYFLKFNWPFKQKKFFK